MRVHDPALITPAFEFYLKHQEHKIDPVEWISDPANIALTNENGDLTLFEKTFKNIYSGHYYFNSRGRKAINAGRDFLDEFFNTCYNVSILMGLTPFDNLAARWMSRQLGFTSHGAITHFSNNKEYEMFILTKKEYNDRWAV